MESFLERCKILVERRWGILAVSALAVAAILFPALIGTHVMGTDATELVIPQLAFYKKVFQEGSTPFWNSYVAVGFPNFVSMNG
ncbi:MAG: hypothetical protein AAB890_02410, partial [Patescibacteria group bacterium]